MFRERPPLFSRRVEREIPALRSPGLFQSLVFPIPTWRDGPALFGERQS